MIISLNSLTEDVDNLAEDTTTEMDAIKEEMEDEEDDSSMNSPPLLPIRPTPTALFQPFLPHRQPEEKPQKSLAFSIDNILRPTFGPANSPPNGLFSPFFHSSLAAAAFAFAAASAASVVSSTTPLSPALSTTSSTSSTPTSPTASTIVKREQKINHNKPVDLSAKNNNNNNNNNNNVISDSDLPSGLKTDEDCPPGMVRGPNGQLWPAWVFCTRYSDRPSSGEFKHK
jgi:homeobox protein engrailed